MLIRQVLKLKLRLRNPSFLPPQELFCDNIQLQQTRKAYKIKNSPSKEGTNLFKLDNLEAASTILTALKNNKSIKSLS